MNGTNQSALRTQSQQLLDGPLKHIKAAALAAALLPLASIAATNASAQTGCPSAGVCGTVFNDANHNGLQDGGESGIEGVKITIVQECPDPTLCFSEPVELYSGPGGVFVAPVPAGFTTTIAVLVPTGTQPSPTDAFNNSYDAIDSDGTPSGTGFSVVTKIADFLPSDFGFFTTPTQPGTGTPGYWKNHPEAWPIKDKIMIGGVSYTQTQAIAILNKVGKDKTTTMFSSLLSAKLNGLIGNNTSCVDAAIAYADWWLSKYPVGSNVSGSSDAWAAGEPYHITLDDYNNGRLCAPHRN